MLVFLILCNENVTEESHAQSRDKGMEGEGQGGFKTG